MSEICDVSLKSSSSFECQNKDANHDFLIGTIMVTEGRMETWVVDLLPQPQESTNDTHQEAEVSVFYVYYCFQNLMLLLCCHWLIQHNAIQLYFDITFLSKFRGVHIR